LVNVIVIHTSTASSGKTLHKYRGIASTVERAILPRAILLVRDDHKLEALARSAFSISTAPGTMINSSRVIRE
jgi:hypothetical protein